MIELRRIICGIVLLLIMTCWSLGQELVGDRSVRVTVTLQDDTGKALSGIVLGLALSRKIDELPITDALTDDSGRAVIDVVVPKAQEELEIRHAFAKPDLSNREQIAAISHLNEIRGTYLLPRTHYITLEPLKAHYELVITAVRGIEVSARVVDANGRPHDCLLWGPPPSYFGSIERGRFKPLRPVRRDAPSLIFVTSNLSSSCSTIVKPIQLTAEETRSNIDLGDIRIDCTQGDVRLEMCLIHPVPIPEGAMPPYGGATCIADDGSLIVSFRGTPRPPGPRNVCLQVPEQDLYPTLPPGRYYVAPEWFHYGEDQIDLIAAVLEKKHIPANVPVIEVTKDGPNSFTIDMVEAHAAIRELAKPAATAPVSPPDH